MALDKYSQLKIAGHVLGFTISDFAKEHSTSIQVIRDVANGHTTSARLEKAIDDRIEEGNQAFDKYRKQKKAASV